MKQVQASLATLARTLGTRRARRILLACLLALQLALLLFWAGQRSNYYIDELFSFGSAHSYSFAKKDVMYINRSAQWQYGSWVDNAVLKDQLRVSGQESLLRQPPLTALRLLLTGRNYHGLLNLLQSAFAGGEVSMAPAIGLNLLLFLAAQLLLWRIMRELTGSAPVSLLCLAMVGFSGMMISTVLYIRFYMLVTFLLLALLRLHQIMWRLDSLPRCEGLTLLSMALLYLAMKDSEMMFIMGGALAASYAAALLIAGQRKKALLYALTVFPASILFALTKTNFIDIALHPASYMDGSGAEAWMTEKLLSVNRGRLVALFFKYLAWLSDLLFGSWYVLCSFMVLVLILLEVRFLGKKKTAPREKGAAAGFIWVIAAVCGIYYVFAMLVAIPAERYFMFYTPLLAILLWKLLHELTAGLPARRALLLGCLVLTGLGAAALQLIRPEKIDFVYREDRPLLQAVSESGLDHAVVIYTSNDKDANHACYECLNLLPDTARLCPIREGETVDLSQCPETLLVWLHKDREPERYVAELLEAGYTLSPLGGTHASDVYIAAR